MSHFKSTELDCSHCGKSGMHPTMLRFIEAYRIRYDAPLVVNSAFRCKDHPIEKVKKTTGTHCLGIAIDFAAPTSQAKFKMVKLAMEMGITRIGYHRDFIHLDIADQLDIVGFPVNVMWPY